MNGGLRAGREACATWVIRWVGIDRPEACRTGKQAVIRVAQKFTLFRVEIVLGEYGVWRVCETPAQFRPQRRIDEKLEDIGLRHLLDGDVRAFAIIPREVRDAFVE